MSDWSIIVTVKKHWMTVKEEQLLRLYGEASEEAAMTYYLDYYGGQMSSSRNVEFVGVAVEEVSDD